jgi:tetratricopeptide (TPR) repeat protein
MASARGEYEAAVARYEDTAWQAEACQQGSVELSAKRAVADLLIARLGRHDEGRTWLRIAEAATQRLGDPARARLLLQSARTNLAYAEGRFEASRDLARAAMQMFERMGGEDLDDRATLLAALGISEAELQDFASARRHLGEAAEALEMVYGSVHPTVALALGNLSTVVYVDALDEALEINARVLAIYEQWPGVLLPERATALAQRAAFAAEGGDLEAALEHATQARALARQAHGPAHFRVAQLEDLLATILLRMGDLPAALAFAQAAVRTSDETQGGDHPDTKAAMQTLADVQAELEGRASDRIGE